MTLMKALHHSLSLGYNSLPAESSLILSCHFFHWFPCSFPKFCIVHFPDYICNNWDLHIFVILIGIGDLLHINLSLGFFATVY